MDAKESVKIILLQYHTLEMWKTQHGVSRFQGVPWERRVRVPWDLGCTPPSRQLTLEAHVSLSIYFVFKKELT